jgi:hypothetical protein
MVYTNNLCLPETYVNACGQPRIPIEGVFTGSEISNPPLQSKLKREHWNELTQDVSEMIWLVFGNAFHAYMEPNAPKESFSEERLFMHYKGIKISGQADLWHNKVIVDYKTTSAWSFQFGDKPEWITQLNIYRMLYFVVLGLDTDKLEVHAILRDWMKSKTYSDDSYPKIAYHVENIPIVDPTPHLDDWLSKIDDPPPCTAEERWERDTTWAVMKGANKTASKVCKSEEEAGLYIEGKGEQCSIVKRPGEAIRCQSYCIVSQFCQYNPYKG